MTLLKTLAVCLVLANVCYFLWERGIAKVPESVVAAPTPGTLKLASESPEASRSEASGSAAATPATGTPATGAPAATGTPATGAPAPPGTGAPAPPATGAPASGSARNAPAAAAALDAGRAGNNSGLLTNVKRCISVGPFRDVSEAAHAASTLRSGGYDPRQRVADGEVWAGVWVYLPLPATRPVVEQTLAKLKAGGIDDALEMPGPNEGSVISLGLYSESKRAQARVAQTQALGFNPGIADRKRNGNVYWIDIDLKPTDGLLNPSDLQGESGRIVRLEVKGCPSAGGQS
ncbi:MAG TPA: hypothetical protein VK523_12245 [Steroidobacteraceae bacterium]|nr:hypothetical protein [Steroidobacteraceae bacterium]